VYLNTVEGINIETNVIIQIRGKKSFKLFLRKKISNQKNSATNSRSSFNIRYLRGRMDLIFPLVLEWLLGPHLDFLPTRGGD
jgi:hypothetical protein